MMGKGYRHVHRICAFLLSVCVASGGFASQDAMLRVYAKQQTDISDSRNEGGIQPEEESTGRLQESREETQGSGVITGTESGSGENNPQNGPDSGSEEGSTQENGPDTGSEEGGTQENGPDSGSEEGGTQENGPDSGSEENSTEENETGTGSEENSTEENETGPDNEEDSTQEETEPGSGEDMLEGTLSGNAAGGQPDQMIKANTDAGTPGYNKLKDTALEYRYDSGKLIVKCNTAWSGSRIIPDADYQDLPWQQYQTKIKTVEIGENVTGIGGDVFKDYSALTAVTLPKTLTVIGENAFKNCISLSGINMPQKLENIGSGAFTGCKKITSVKLPDTLTVLGASAFENAEALTTVTLSKNLTAISEGTFKGCKKLNKMVIPANVGEIGKEAFYGCEALAAVDLPASITRISDSTFFGCKALKSVTIPESVTYIGNGAFRDCAAMVSVSIPDGVKEIGTYAFAGCKVLTGITLPNNLAKISQSLFEGCEALKDLYIPEAVNIIEDYAFKNCQGIKNMILPDAVKSIGKEAFSECRTLKNINIGNVETIGSRAFFKCIELEEIVMNRTVTIGDEAFLTCTALKAVILPSSVAAVGKNAFKLCSGVKTIAVFAGNMTIGKDAFATGSTVDTLALQNGVTQLDGFNFSNAVLKFNLDNTGITITGIIPRDDTITIVAVPSTIGEYTVKLITAADAPGGVNIRCDYTGDIAPASNWKAQTHNWIDGECTVCKQKQFCTVRFYEQRTVSGNGIENIEYVEYKQTVPYGSTLKMPVPEKENASFLGWYVNGIQYTDYSYINIDRNFYAKWQEDTAAGDFSIGMIPDQVYTGKAIQPDIRVKSNGVLLKKGVDYTLSYKNNIKVGEAVITVTGKGNYKSSANKQTIKFKIITKNIKDSDILVTLPDQKYTGNEIRISPVLKWGKETLKAGKDYVIGEYRGDLVRGPKVSFEIDGLGRFSGKRTLEYQISNLYDISKASLTIDKSVSLGYSEIATEPKLTVKYTIAGKAVQLELDKDYTVTYQNNKALSTSKSVAKATIKGKGNYFGTKSIDFKVVKKDISKGNDVIIQAIANQTYTGAAIKVIPKVTYQNRILELNKDYTLSYSNNINAASVTASSPPQVIVKGKGNYSGTLKARFTISPRAITLPEIEVITGGALYNAGKAVNPNVSVYDKAKKLTLNKDFTYVVSNNTDKGQRAVVTVRGKGNYRDSITRNFNITDYSIANAAVKVAAQIYTGLEVTPSCTVTYAGTILTEGKDYLISAYTNNIMPGRSATLSIIGTGIYAGAKTVNFTIGAKPITSDDISASIYGSYEYTGAAVMPEPVVTDGALVLTRGTDYTLSWSNNVKAGTDSVQRPPTVMIKGKGSYSGSRSIAFTIGTRDIAEAEFNVSDMQFNGNYITPAVKATDNGSGKTVILKKGIDYQIIECKNNLNYETSATTEEQKPYIVVKGIGNYAGDNEIIFKFRIYRYNISRASVSAIAAKMYTGQAVRPDSDEIKAVYSGTPLVQDQDYTLDYGSDTDNIKAGKGAVSINGKGSYGGTKKLTYNILPKFLWNLIY